jgi:pilus biogenesis lipoprotein CpaD
MPVPLSHAPACRAAVLLAALLQACAPTASVPPASSAPPRIEATSSVHRHVVSFETGRSRPNPTEAARLGGFLASLPGDGRVGFTVVGHADVRGPETFNAKLAEQRAIEVARLIRAGGFPDATVEIRSRGEQAPTASGGSAAALAQSRRVEITAELVQPYVVGCPAATNGLAATWRNDPFPGLGCSNLENLVRMLDDPRDLTAGRATTAADGIRESEAIVRYRTDKVKSLDDVEVSQ